MPAIIAVPVRFTDMPEGDELKDWMSETLDQLGEFAARDMTITAGRPTIWVAEDGRCWFHVSIENPADLDAPDKVSAARSVVASLLFDQGHDHDTATILIDDIHALDSAQG